MQSIHLKTLFVAFAALFMIACGGDGADGRNGIDGQDADPLVVESTEAEDCPDGGTLLTFGYDTTGDGSVDEELSSQTVCNGEDGTNGDEGDDGNSVLTETEPADAADCPDGGTTVTFGYDTTGDDAIDEVLETTDVCNGEDGEDGSSVLVESSAADAADCPNGGTTMTFGFDTDGDDTIDQVLETTDVCNGDDGSSVLVESSAADVATCPNGGTTMTFGYDTDGDDTIDQVLETTDVCNGEDGRSVLVESSAADAGTCPNGGTSMTFGYDTTGDDAIDEVLDTTDVCNGIDGEDGNSVLVESASAAAGTCTNGGTTFTFGYDTTGDDSIDQVLDTTDVCNGENGDDGNSALVESAPAPSDACANGGTTLTFGYDTTGNGSIDQIVDTATVCDGNAPFATITGKSVLYFDDSSDAGNVFLGALQALDAAGTISLTVSTQAQVAGEIDSGNYDIVFLSNRANSFGPAIETSLTTWVSGGGLTILSSWENNSTLYGAFEANRVGNNLSSATFDDPVLGFQLGMVPVTNEGWGTYALQLEATGSGYSVCTWENGTSCAVVGNGGDTVLLGFLSDSISAADAERVVRNALWQVTL